MLEKMNWKVYSILSAEEIKIENLKGTGTLKHQILCKGIKSKTNERGRHNFKLKREISAYDIFK